MTDNSLYDRKHLRNLKQIFPSAEPEIYFITICAYKKQKILIEESITNMIIDTLKKSPVIHGWAVGRYVIMPDHVHFFCAPVENRKNLTEYIRDIKKWTTKEFQKMIPGQKLWQKEYFDHLLRNTESYDSKWHYVRNNPVRAGLCATHDEWPHHGEIVKLQK